MPSRKAARDAISKASPLESTSWLAPSISVAVKSISGKPASTPVSRADLRPFSTPGMNSRGTEPPVMAFSKLKPCPCCLDLALDLCRLAALDDRDGLAAPDRLAEVARQRD